MHNFFFVVETWTDTPKDRRTDRRKQLPQYFFRAGDKNWIVDGSTFKGEQTIMLNIIIK